MLLQANATYCIYLKWTNVNFIQTIQLSNVLAILSSPVQKYSLLLTLHTTNVLIADTNKLKYKDKLRYFPYTLFAFFFPFF